MNDVFDPISIRWDGKDYVVPPNKVMGMIRRIEQRDPSIDWDGLTLPEVMEYAKRKTMPFAIMSTAYAICLRYAGCEISDACVYRELTLGGDGAIPVRVMSLLQMMLPPERLANKSPVEQGGAAKKHRRGRSS